MRTALHLYDRYNVQIQFSMSNDQIRGTFTGNVQCIVPNTTPPVIQVIPPAPVQATSPQGAVVTYTVVATDVEDGQVTPTCTPPSGSVFPVGNTQVRCTATDSAGNAVIATLTITVTPQPLPPIPTPPPESACIGVGSGNSPITGTNGPDTLIGTSAPNSMNGLGGNDAMNGCDGRDIRQGSNES